MGEPSGVSTGLAEKRSWGPSSRQARMHRALGCTAAVTPPNLGCFRHIWDLRQCP